MTAYTIPELHSSNLRNAALFSANCGRGMEGFLPDFARKEATASHSQISRNPQAAAASQSTQTFSARQSALFLKRIDSRSIERSSSVSFRDACCSITSCCRSVHKNSETEMQSSLGVDEPADSSSLLSLSVHIEFSGTRDRYARRCSTRVSW